MGVFFPLYSQYFFLNPHIWQGSRVLPLYVVEKIDNTHIVSKLYFQMDVREGNLIFPLKLFRI
jgi:hypothetical protein